MSTDSQINIRKINVRNIVSNVTADDLFQLFGLGTTPVIQRNSSVVVTQCETGNYAVVNLPEHVHGEILNFNGHEFHGRKMEIEVDTETNMQTPANNVEEPEEEIMFIEVDTRLPEWNFKHVTVTEVIDALQVEHGDDFTKAVKKCMVH